MTVRNLTPEEEQELHADLAGMMPSDDLFDLAAENMRAHGAAILAEFDSQDEVLARLRGIADRMERDNALLVAFLRGLQ